MLVVMPSPERWLGATPRTSAVSESAVFGRLDGGLQLGKERLP